MARIRVSTVIDASPAQVWDEVRIIEAAAPLHDMGKIAIPDSVLLKEGKLDEDELAIMRRHPRIGYELLSGSQNRFIQVGALIALRHHERFDGSGYPDGLIGEAIPLEARIVAVADVFDALVSPRPYKEAWTVDATLAYLYAQRGRLFDPRCVDALIRGREALQQICERFSTASVSASLSDWRACLPSRACWRPLLRAIASTWRTLRPWLTI